MRSRLCALMLLAACGRLDFRETHAPSDAPAGSPIDTLVVAGDAPRDAPSDAPLVPRDVQIPPSDTTVAADAAVGDAPTDAAPLVIGVDPGPHHLGDTPGGTPNTPQGTVITDPFTVPVACGAATLELDFIGPFGPNMNDEPTLRLDGTDLGHVFPFFPPFTDPAWAAANGEYNGPNDDHMFTIHVVLPCAPALGSNTFVFTDNDSTDDMFFANVVLRCDNPGS